MRGKSRQAVGTFHLANKTIHIINARYAMNVQTGGTIRALRAFAAPGLMLALCLSGCADGTFETLGPSSTSTSNSTSPRSDMSLPSGHEDQGKTVVLDMASDDIDMRSAPDDMRATPDMSSQPPPTEDMATPVDMRTPPVDMFSPPPPDMASMPPDCSDVMARTTIPSSPPQSASWKWGGGKGYPDAVRKDGNCMTVVSTRAQLESALASASPGEVIYIEDDARIDLTGAELKIPGNIWLASGRGQNGKPGALLYSEDIRRPLIRIQGSDVRITGLRILGHEPTQCPVEYPDACTQPDRTGGTNCRDCTRTTIGILARGHDRVEIDNNELAGWSSSAVTVRDAADAHIHHNDIHHTQRQGLGYGVVLGGDLGEEVDVLIEWNRFDYNRHAVAGSGEPGQDYTARHNLVEEHANGHVFDMHGEAENGVGPQVDSPYAGGELLIHDNIVLVPNYYTLVVRGRPEHGSYLYNNCLARTSSSQAARQNFFTGNFYVDRGPQGSAPNSYGQSASQCGAIRWCISSGGEGPWSYLNTSGTSLSGLLVGDFDGDGRDDIFRATGSKWQWSKSGSSGWQDLNSSSYEASRLRVGDFNGDGKEDIFSATGSRWQYSSGGSAGWQTLRDASEREGDLLFGDFDGDGKTDVFRATGSKWQWSRSGTSGWQDLNTSGVGIASLAVGDFNGDGKDDIFNATGSQWRVSYGGTGSWQMLTGSSYRLDRIALVDMDGDGKTDVVRQGGDSWWISRGGATGWRRLRIDSRSLDSVAFGQFDTRPGMDIFRTRCL